MGVGVGGAGPGLQVMEPQCLCRQSPAACQTTCFSHPGLEEKGRQVKKPVVAQSESRPCACQGLGRQRRVSSWSARWSCRASIAGFYAGQILTVPFLHYQSGHTRKHAMATTKNGSAPYGTTDWQQPFPRAVRGWGRRNLLPPSLQGLGTALVEHTGL